MCHLNERGEAASELRGTLAEESNAASALDEMTVQFGIQAANNLAAVSGTHSF
jgi:hypothetical protein